MVQMNNVTMIYDSSGTEALNGVDSRSTRGIRVLLSASGSGKTTIIKLSPARYRPSGRDNRQRL
ncbi:MAG: hypothetical protein ACLUEK_03580 [Oscillospiraceae bacterium]